MKDQQGVPAVCCPTPTHDSSWQSLAKKDKEGDAGGREEVKEVNAEESSQVLPDIDISTSLPRTPSCCQPHLTRDSRSVLPILYAQNKAVFPSSSSCILEAGKTKRTWSALFIIIPNLTTGRELLGWSTYLGQSWYITRPDIRTPELCLTHSWPLVNKSHGKPKASLPLLFSSTASLFQVFVTMYQDFCISLPAASSPLIFETVPLFPMRIPVGLSITRNQGFQSVFLNKLIRSPLLLFHDHQLFHN